MPSKSISSDRNPDALEGLRRWNAELDSKNQEFAHELNQLRLEHTVLIEKMNIIASDRDALNTQNQQLMEKLRLLGEVVLSQNQDSLDAQRALVDAETISAEETRRMNAALDLAELNTKHAVAEVESLRDQLRTNAEYYEGKLKDSALIFKNEIEKTINSLQDAHEREVSELKLTHQKELSEMKDQLTTELGAERLAHTSVLSALQATVEADVSQYETRIADLEKEFELARSQWDYELKSILERVHAEHVKACESLQTEFEIRLSQSEDASKATIQSLQSEIKQLKLVHSSQLESLTESRNREIEDTKSALSNELDSLRAAHEAAMIALEQEKSVLISDLEDRLDTARSEHQHALASLRARHDSEMAESAAERAAAESSARTAIATARAEAAAATSRSSSVSPGNATAVAASSAVAAERAEGDARLGAAVAAERAIHARVSAELEQLKVELEEYRQALNQARSESFSAFSALSEERRAALAAAEKASAPADTQDYMRKLLAESEAAEASLRVVLESTNSSSIPKTSSLGGIDASVVRAELEAVLGVLEKHNDRALQVDSLVQESVQLGLKPLALRDDVAAAVVATASAAAREALFADVRANESALVLARARAVVAHAQGASAPLQRATDSSVTAAQELQAQLQRSLADAQRAHADELRVVRAAFAAELESQRARAADLERDLLAASKSASGASSLENREEELLNRVQQLELTVSRARAQATAEAERAEAAASRAIAAETLAASLQVSLADCSSKFEAERQAAARLFSESLRGLETAANAAASRAVALQASERARVGASAVFPLVAPLESECAGLRARAREAEARALALAEALELHEGLLASQAADFEARLAEFARAHVEALGAQTEAARANEAALSLRFEAKIAQLNAELAAQTAVSSTNPVVSELAASYSESLRRERQAHEAELLAQRREFSATEADRARLHAEKLNALQLAHEAHCGVLRASLAHCEASVAALAGSADARVEAFRASFEKSAAAVEALLAERQDAGTLQREKEGLVDAAVMASCAAVARRVALEAANNVDRSLLSPVAAPASTPAPDEVAALKEELCSLKSEKQQLEAQLEGLQGSLSDLRHAYADAVAENPSNPSLLSPNSASKPTSDDPRTPSKSASPSPSHSASPSSSAGAATTASSVHHRLSAVVFRLEASERSAVELRQQLALARAASAQFGPALAGGFGGRVGAILAGNRLRTRLDALLGELALARVREADARAATAVAHAQADARIQQLLTQVHALSSSSSSSSPASTDPPRHRASPARSSSPATIRRSPGSPTNEADTAVAVARARAEALLQVAALRATHAAELAELRAQMQASAPAAASTAAEGDESARESALRATHALVISDLQAKIVSLSALVESLSGSRALPDTRVISIAAALGSTANSTANSSSSVGTGSTASGDASLVFQLSISEARLREQAAEHRAELERVRARAQQEREALSADLAAAAALRQTADADLRAALAKLALSEERCQALQTALQGAEASGNGTSFKEKEELYARARALEQQLQTASVEVRVLQERLETQQREAAAAEARARERAQWEQQTLERAHALELESLRESLARLSSSSSSSDSQLAVLVEQLHEARAEHLRDRAELEREARENLEAVAARHRAELARQSQLLTDAELARARAAASAREDALRSAAAAEAALQDRINQLERRLAVSEERRATEVAAVESRLAGEMNAAARAHAEQLRELHAQLLAKEALRLQEWQQHERTRSREAQEAEARFAERADAAAAAALLKQAELRREVEMLRESLENEAPARAQAVDLGLMRARADSERALRELEARSAREMTELRAAHAAALEKQAESLRAERDAAVEAAHARARSQLSDSADAQRRKLLASEEAVTDLKMRLIQEQTKCAARTETVVALKKALSSAEAERTEARARAERELLAQREGLERAAALVAESHRAELELLRSELEAARAAYGAASQDLSQGIGSELQALRARFTEVEDGLRQQLDKQTAVESELRAQLVQQASVEMELRAQLESAQSLGARLLQRLEELEAAQAAALAALTKTHEAERQALQVRLADETAALRSQLEEAQKEGERTRERELLAASEAQTQRLAQQAAAHEEALREALEQQKLAHAAALLQLEQRCAERISEAEAAASSAAAAAQAAAATQIAEAARRADALEASLKLSASLELKELEVRLNESKQAALREAQALHAAALGQVQAVADAEIADLRVQMESQRADALSQVSARSADFRAESERLRAEFDARLAAEAAEHASQRASMQRAHETAVAELRKIILDAEFRAEMSDSSAATALAMVRGGVAQAEARAAEELAALKAEEALRAAAAAAESSQNLQNLRQSLEGRVAQAEARARDLEQALAAAEARAAAGRAHAATARAEAEFSSLSARETIETNMEILRRESRLSFDTVAAELSSTRVELARLRAEHAGCASERARAVQDLQGLRELDARAHAAAVEDMRSAAQSAVARAAQAAEDVRVEFAAQLEELHRALQQRELDLRAAADAAAARFENLLAAAAAKDAERQRELEDLGARLAAARAETEQERARAKQLEEDMRELRVDEEDALGALQERLRKALEARAVAQKRADELLARERVLLDRIDRIQLSHAELTLSGPNNGRGSPALHARTASSASLLRGGSFRSPVRSPSMRVSNSSLLKQSQPSSQQQDHLDATSVVSEASEDTQASNNNNSNNKANEKKDRISDNTEEIYRGRMRSLEDQVQTLQEQLAAARMRLESTQERGAKALAASAAQIKSLEVENSALLQSKDAELQRMRALVQTAQNECVRLRQDLRASLAARANAIAGHPHPILPASPAPDLSTSSVSLFGSKPLDQCQPLSPAPRVDETANVADRLKRSRQLDTEAALSRIDLALQSLITSSPSNGASKSTEAARPVETTENKGDPTTKKGEDSVKVEGLNLSELAELPLELHASDNAKEPPRSHSNSQSLADSLSAISATLRSEHRLRSPSAGSAASYVPQLHSPSGVSTNLYNSGSFSRTLSPRRTQSQSALPPASRVLEAYAPPPPTAIQELEALLSPPPLPPSSGPDILASPSSARYPGGAHHTARK